MNRLDEIRARADKATPGRWEWEKYILLSPDSKEPRELWANGIVYADGHVNKLYQAYILGYSLGRIEYLHGEEAHS